MKCNICHKEIESDYLATLGKELSDFSMGADMHLSCMVSGAKWFAKNKAYVEFLGKVMSSAYDRGFNDGQEKCEDEAYFDE
jgi:hypothetical protein